MSAAIVQMFDYQGQQVRTVIINGEPWFVAKDVCDILEHSNSRMALAPATHRTEAHAP